MTISVLIPCYNAGLWVRECLESVVRQSYQDIEIIVVDDASTDNSAEIIASFPDPRISLIRQRDNQGAANARNAAFHASTGEFVIFLDADDIIGPEHLECLLNRLRSEPNCLALSQWTRFQNDFRSVVFPRRPTERDMGGCDWLMLDWSRAQPMTQSGMFLIPRRLIELHGGWNPKLGLIDDFEFFARIIAKSDGMRFAPGAQLYYRSNIAGSLSGQRGRRAVISQLESLTLGTNHLLNVRSDPAARSICANLFQAFCYEHFPWHSDLRKCAAKRIYELGGSSIEPDGPPKFHILRRLIGWKLARLTEIFAKTFLAGRTNP